MMADTPYETIGNAVEAWCNEHFYDTMLVSISLHYDGEEPREITEILEFDANDFGLIWDSDWWEGQQNVELLGFSPLSSMHFRGSPLILDRDHAFEFKLDDEAAQEQVIRDAKKYGMAVLKPKTDYISREAARETLLTAYPLLQRERLDTTIASIPAADVVPMDFHERCLQIEIQKRMTLEKADVREVVLCKDCRHRDPEDHKCDCGGTERQGCPFKVEDDYFCAYGER